MQPMNAGQGCLANELGEFDRSSSGDSRGRLEFGDDPSASMADLDTNQDELALFEDGITMEGGA
jgi:hypothetical protein